ncbi:hypothetical protein [Maribellus mangrovi]|uniref:hypothetical protein n=1 Tax=Maribellus mangrovi TaxID=3133146 RepID=UPI0030EED9B3
MYFAVLDIDCSYWKNVTGTDTPNYPEFEQTLQKYMYENAASDEEKVIRLITLLPAALPNQTFPVDWRHFNPKANYGIVSRVST